MIVLFSLLLVFGNFFVSPGFAFLVVSRSNTCRTTSTSSSKSTMGKMVLSYYNNHHHHHHFQVDGRSKNNYKDFDRISKIFSSTRMMEVIMNRSTNNNNNNNFVDLRQRQRRRNLSVLNMASSTKSGGIGIKSIDDFATMVLLHSRSSSENDVDEEDDDDEEEKDDEMLLMSMEDQTTTTATTRKPIQLVLFLAPWCGPCRLTIPVVKDMMDQFSTNVDFYELNTDDLPEIAEGCHITSIPTIQLYHNGQIEDTIVGCVANNVLASCISTLLEEFC